MHNTGTMLRILTLTTLAMLAFAGNSLLCRVALSQTSIDAASFTSLRLISGALALMLIVSLRRPATRGSGRWSSALLLFIYAAGFSFAYISLPTATGALLLFGAVQSTMIAYGLYVGERLRRVQLGGLLLAFAGVIALLLPGISAPPLAGALLMIAAGVAWGVYSLHGKNRGDAIAVSAGNFIRTVPFTLLLSVVMFARFEFDATGALYAVVSGVLASALGYAIWYTVLPALRATHAATVQLSVPVIAAVGGVVLLGEAISLRLLLTSLAILGGIALVLIDKPR